MTASIDGFEIDAVESEDHSFDSDVTDFPVEQGANVTDNKRLKPLVINLDCVVSDTPSGPIATRRDPSILPSAEAYQRLQALDQSKRTCVVVTTRGMFESMMLTSLGIPVKAADGKSIRFNASFKQVKILTSTRTQVRVARAGHKKHANRGPRPPAPVVDAPAQADAAASSGYRDTWMGRAGDSLGITDGPGAVNIGQQVDASPTELKSLAAYHAAGLI